VARKKKLIWFEQETVVGGAGEARRRGAAPSPARHRHRSEPFYGPVTVAADDAGPDDPDDRRPDDD
jgi:hypothetical protein